MEGQKSHARFANVGFAKRQRKKGAPYSRNALAVYIEGIEALLETPEDISDSLTRWDIPNINYIFLSHWHPDHTFGLRTAIQAYYDWNRARITKSIDLYLSELAYERLVQVFGAIKHFEEAQGLRIHLMRGNKPLKIKNWQIAFIPTEREDIGGFLFEHSGKRVAFAPCDVKNIKEEELENLDLLIHECGWFPKDPQGNILVDDFELWPHEIQFTETIERVKRVKPKQTVLVGLEEVYQRGYDDYRRLEKKYTDLNLRFAYDGMAISV